jgi:hypothetical protein
MGKHRDNFHRPDLKLLADNKKAKLPEKGTWASAVIVYSMGKNCPMKMMFSRLSPGGGAYQKKT